MGRTSRCMPRLVSYRRILTAEGLVRVVSRNIRRLRYAAGLTLQQAARRGGMGLRRWQKAEAGETNLTLKTISKLCARLGVDPVELFRWSSASPI